MATPLLSDDWRELLVLLIKKKVRFLVVGGHALAVHAEPRFTKDLDLLVEPTLANGRRLRAALLALGFGPMAPEADELRAPGPFWVFGRPPQQVDVLTKIPGVVFRSAWGRRVEVKLGALRIPVIGRADLLAAKRAAGRPQDVADVAAIESFGEGRARSARLKRSKHRPP